MKFKLIIETSIISKPIKLYFWVNICLSCRNSINTFYNLRKQVAGLWQTEYKNIITAESRDRANIELLNYRFITPANILKLRRE